MYVFPGERMLSGIVKIYENVLVPCIFTDDHFCVTDFCSHSSSSNYEAK